MGWGAVALAIGILTTVIGIILPMFSDSGSEGALPYVAPRMPVLNPWKWPVTWCGIGLTNIGVLLLLAGYIVRAIYFLPGRGATVAPAAIPDSAPPSAVGEVGDDSGSSVDASSADRIITYAIGGSILVVVGIFLIMVLN